MKCAIVRYLSTFLPTISAIEACTYLQLACVYSFVYVAVGSNWDGRQQAADLKADHLMNAGTITVKSSLQRATIGEIIPVRNATAA